MLDAINALTVISIWLIAWYVIYVVLIKYYRPLLFFVVFIHLLLIWVFISLFFYWFYMQSSLIFGTLCLLILLQAWYLIARVSRVNK